MVTLAYKSIKNTAGNYADIVVGYCGVDDKDIAMDVLHTFAFPSS